MRVRAALGIAVAAIGLVPAASAQTRVMNAHVETAFTLKCLLDHDRTCGQRFVARASVDSKPWLWWNAEKDFGLGRVLSWQYAGTEPVNFYTARYLNGRPADIYDVKFKRQEKTFYIVPPGPDGRVHYMYVRNGGPDDEIVDFWATTP